MCWIYLLTVLVQHVCWYVSLYVCLLLLHPAQPLVPVAVRSSLQKQPLAAVRRCCEHMRQCALCAWRYVVVWVVCALQFCCACRSRLTQPL